MAFIEVTASLKHCHSNGSKLADNQSSRMPNDVSLRHTRNLVVANRLLVPSLRNLSAEAPRPDPRITPIVIGKDSGSNARQASEAWRIEETSVIVARSPAIPEKRTLSDSARHDKFRPQRLGPATLSQQPHSCRLRSNVQTLLVMKLLPPMVLEQNACCKERFSSNSPPSGPPLQQPRGPYLRLFMQKLVVQHHQSLRGHVGIAAATDTGSRLKADRRSA